MNKVSGRIGIVGLFIGLVACAGPGAPSATVSPSGSASAAALASPQSGGSDWELLLHFAPATGIEPTGLAEEGEPNPRMTVTGHFDDRAAQRCAPNPPTTLDGTAAYWTCTTLFVVEQLN
jgi:hypothetical protein